MKSLPYLLPLVEPDFGAVGGSSELRKIVGALLTYGLVTSVLMVVICAATWAIGSAQGNWQSASKAGSATSDALSTATTHSGFDTRATCRTRPGGGCPRDRTQSADESYDDVGGRVGQTLLVMPVGTSPPGSARTRAMGCRASKRTTEDRTASPRTEISSPPPFVPVHPRSSPRVSLAVAPSHLRDHSRRAPSLIRRSRGPPWVTCRNVRSCLRSARSCR